MNNEPTNKDRFLINAIRSLSTERGIDFEVFSHDWIVRLKRDDIVRYIYGYNFDLNPAAASFIATDKSALSDSLSQSDVPHVEHEFFLTPLLSAYLGPNGNWGRAIQAAERFGYPLVCKGNQGTGGNRVFRVHDQKELEEAFQRVHSSERGLAMSPFYEIDAEYRAIVLDGELLLCYGKEQPTVTGDGASTYSDLLMANYSTQPEVLTRALAEPTMSLDGVLTHGQELSLIWKHNLGKGATPNFVVEPELTNDLLKLARAACESTGMRFASVDIISSNGSLKVLELNSGIMMEHISNHSDFGREIAFKVYRAALAAMFP